MQTSSAPHAAVETEAVSLQIYLLALNLAIELARGGDTRDGSSLPAIAARDLCELLVDDAHQMGGGEGIRRAVEELERALRQAGEAVRRPAAAGQADRGAESSGVDRHMRTEGVGGR
jgi:hypothetical protein